MAGVQQLLCVLLVTLAATSAGGPKETHLCCYFGGCKEQRDKCSPANNSCSRSVTACRTCGGTLCPAAPGPAPPTPTPKKKFTCDGRACVPDPGGAFGDRSCDNQCQIPPPGPPSPAPPLPPSPLPARPLGHYLLIADDGTPYDSTRDWQPVLHPYQQQGSNLLYLFTINATNMPHLPPAFINLAKTRGTNAPGSVPKDTLIIAALGGETYSTDLSWWKFLTGSASDARAMGEQIAAWKKLGIDGIDLDIEQGIGDDKAAGANLLEMIKGIREKEPSFIITNPKDGYPGCKATDHVINHAWDARSQSLGVLDRVSIMYYKCQESLNWVKDYANATGQYQGFPITVDVPTENIIVGIGGGDSEECITGLAHEVKSRRLGGIMVWFSSVLDGATNATAISYTKRYDSSVAQSGAWASALRILAGADE